MKWIYRVKRFILGKKNLKDRFNEYLRREKNIGDGRNGFDWEAARLNAY